MAGVLEVRTSSVYCCVGAGALDHLLEQRAADPLALADRVDGDVHQMPDGVVARQDQVSDQPAARRRRRRPGTAPEGLESSSTNMASDQGVVKARRSIEMTCGRSP